MNSVSSEYLCKDAKYLKTVKPTEDEAVHQFMLEKENEGKHKKVAKIAAFNKFLRIYYARVKEVYGVVYRICS